MVKPTFKTIQYWPTWVGLGVLWVVGNLPYRVQLGLGWCLGQGLYFFPNVRREVARINLELCFPELSKSSRKKLLQQTLCENMIGIVLASRTWFGDIDCLKDCVTIEGVEHIESAIKQNKGVLWIGLHFATLDFACALVARITNYPCCALFRNFKDELFDVVIKKKRQHYFKHLIERTNMRRIVSLLKSGELLWYAPDQDFGAKHSVFAPFFKIPVATITATMRLAKISNCAVIVSRYHRTKNGGYAIVFQPALQGFPSGNYSQDAGLLNAEFEATIRENPTQYMWLHRRFKTRPLGTESPYKNLSIRNKIGLKISKKRFDRYISTQHKQLTSGSVLKPSVLMTGQEVYKLFWSHILWSKCYWAPAWKFYRNAQKLSQLDVQCPLPTTVAYYSGVCAHVVIYPKLLGVTIEKKISTTKNYQILQLLAEFLAVLHRKGILFNGITLSHILIDEKKQIRLISVERIRFSSSSLSQSLRITNLQQLLFNQKDNKIFLNYGIEKFIDKYLLSADHSDVRKLFFKRLQLNK